ncbi:MAG: DNA sulfur modification protein DndD [Verrucomicrobiales bacterium]
MTLNRVILDNFGAYGGRQEIFLTPEPDKPVILFGGMNGGGKTTLLDSIQLGFYGRKAKTSNRGSLAYRDYLAECLHRGADPGEGAAITIHFHRMAEGRATRFELQRSWRQGSKGIEETLRVSKDGEPDELLTEHWDESLEAYLPVGIAHLFFFDGEQIKELAEGHHAARIIGTAIHSLLGLDLVDRLENDLKVFERRKKAETIDAEALLRLKQAEDELEHLLADEANTLQEEGRLVNEAGRLAGEVAKAREAFENEGGTLFLRHKELETELRTLQETKQGLQDELRSLAAGALPLLLLEPQLAEVQAQARHENEIRHARVLGESLDERDGQLLKLLRSEAVDTKVVGRITRHLAKERKELGKTAGEDLVLDAEPAFESDLRHLRENTLPAARERTRQLLADLSSIDERIARLESDLSRVPDQDRIAAAQRILREKQEAHQALLHRLEEIKVRKKALRSQCERAEQHLDRIGSREIDARFEEDSRKRMLRHSAKVRETLAAFKTRVIRKHIRKIESLMLESFRSLLRKSGLVSGLTIDPETFAVTLLDRVGKPLSFDRLSAGERQLLATSLLWGLARASGRPVPTIIDTPLGRLDSSHRRHLTERYFPLASHQVLLLSTDEEIVGTYLQTLSPFIARTYHLVHDEKLGSTSVKPGYFPQHETTR